MSKINRYNFARNYYKKYAIILLDKHKLYVYEDNKFINFNKINKLKELHINYIILVNLSVIKREYEDNKYKEYYTKYSLNKIMDEVLNKYKEGMK